MTDHGNESDDGRSAEGRETNTDRHFYTSTFAISVAAGFLGSLLILVLDKILQPDRIFVEMSLFWRTNIVVAIFAFAISSARNYAVIDGIDAPPNSVSRKRFEAFRQDLLDGGTPARVYNLWLGRMLDAVDRFFGDAGRADRSWVARLMRLETPGPRWTAVAYDRCLLLALLYPVLVVFVVWVISGRVGPAEAALGLRESAAGWTWDTAKRGGALLSLVALAVTSVGSARAEGRAKLYWVIAFAGAAAGAAAGAVAGAFAGAGAGVGVGVGVFAGTGAGAVAFAGAVAVAVAGAVAVAVAGAGAVAGAVVVVGAVAGAFMTLSERLYEYTIHHNRFGPFLFTYSIVGSIVLLALPFGLVPLKTWHTAGALLLFFGLLTLINAPVDWLALGFTRALLRKGLVKSGWWPFGFALVDLVVAAVLVAGLAFVLVFAVQFFDDMAALRGGPEARILPLRPLFAMLHDTPTAYEVWWVWAMLFSSMIPSFVNLTIAAAAFLRGLPAVHARVLARLEPNRALGTWDRIGLAATLAGQVVIGGMLAIGVFYAVAMVVLPMVLPAFAHLLLTFADGLAEADLPAQMIEVLQRR